MKLGFLSGTPEPSLVAQLVDPLRVAPESRMLALLHGKTSEVCWKVTNFETPEKKTETLYFMSHLLPYGGQNLSAIKRTCLFF